MDERQSDGDLTSIESRAWEFVAHVEWLTSTTPNREDAFDLVFGLSGVYVKLFPTLDDRLALRELQRPGTIHNGGMPQCNTSLIKR